MVILLGIFCSRPLTKQYQDVAKSIFLQSAGTDTSSARKKTHSDLQEKITGLWTNARLFEKGLKLLPGKFIFYKTCIKQPLKTD